MENEGQRQATQLEIPLLLASQSPRRAEILRQVGWRFTINVADIDETQHASERAEDYVRRLADQKASAVAAKTQSHSLVLGADTTVLLDDTALGKPRDTDEAREMLRRLNNRWHEVLTGVALIEVEAGEVRRRLNDYERTRVLFGEMSEREIEVYLSSNEYADKAGAYAVQGRAAKFIERIEGDYWNVVGLPIRLVYKLVRQFE